MNKIVAVTGANGFIASVLVKTLLEKGYTVVGTVRDPQNEEKVGHLKSLPNSQNLRLVKATFENDQNDFISAFKGVDCVFHTANPVSLTGTEEEMVKIPIQGAEKVLRAVEANKNTIRNFIYTSSILCCMSFTEPYSKNVWTDIVSCEKDNFFYAVGKTQAEKLTLQFFRNSPINYVSILPSLVQGQVLPKTNPSLDDFLINIIKGNDYTAGALLFHNIVDVQDVADMHVNAYEKNVKEGRFLAIGDTFDMHQYSTTLKRVCQEEGIDEKVIIKEALPENDKWKINWTGKEESLDLLGRQFNTLESVLTKTLRSVNGRNYF